MSFLKSKIHVNYKTIIIFHREKGKNFILVKCRVNQTKSIYCTV